MNTIRVTTNDGLSLHTEITLPERLPAPAVLIRTPYGTSAHRQEATGWAKRGYAAVVQDVRGRYRSAGSWVPYTHEGGDGAATIAAVAASEWCDGRVVCLGSSYSAHCALVAAAASPGPVAAIVVAVPALSPRRVARDRNGAPRFYGHSWWWFQHGQGRTSSSCPIHDASPDEPGALSILPAIGLPSAAGVAAAGWSLPWLRDGLPDSSPTPLDAPPPTGSPPAPLLVLAGLHDVFRDDALDLADGWPGQADVVVGAWQHDLGLVHRDGDAALRRHQAHRIKPGVFIADWLERTLRDPDATTPGSRYFALEGTGAWARPAPARPQLPCPLSAARTRFVADPCHPHPSALGPVDVHDISRREDLARFVSDPVRIATDVVGRMVVRLSGMAAHTLDGEAVRGPLDWCVRVALRPAPADRDHTGAGLLQLGHALVRTPDSRARVELPLVARRLHPGARIEVHVSAHQFPLYARDPQDGTEPLTATRLRPARRQVLRANVELPLAELAPDPTEPKEALR